MDSSRFVKGENHMYNEERVLEEASKELRNFVYLYGGEGYFTSIDNNCFEIEIYDLRCGKINRMKKAEAEKHLLRKLAIDFSELSRDQDVEIIGFKIACKVMDKLK